MKFVKYQLLQRFDFQYREKVVLIFYLSTRISTYISPLSLTAVPRSFALQAGAAAACAIVPVDFDITEGDIHGFAKTIIPAAVQGVFFHHHKVDMMPGTDARVVDVPNFLTLCHRRSHHL